MSTSQSEATMPPVKRRACAKPADNSFIESLDGKLRAGCLNTHWFMSLDGARMKMEDWRRDYDEVRPHSAIGNKAPISLLNGSSAPTPA